MLNELAKMFVNESARNIGVEIGDVTIVDEKKFVEYAKNRLDSAIVEEPDNQDIEKLYYGNLELYDRHCTLFHFNEMTPNYHFDGYRTKKSSFSVWDIKLLIMLEAESPFSSWNGLKQQIGMQTPVIQRIIFNLQQGFFDEYLESTPHFSKDFGVLYVNGESTGVSIKTVKYIVDCVVNSSHPASTILKLEKNAECPVEVCRLIGTNYKNEQLNGLFDKPIVEIENNPEKRKEMGL